MGQLKATEQVIRRLRRDGRLAGREALAELARGLSRALDNDDPDATLAGIAAVSKELRATLAALEMTPDDDGDFDDEFRRLLSSEVGDSEES